jgi:predicted permease
MDYFFQDVRYSLRRLARAPGTTLFAVLALGLAVGANAVIFSVVRGVLLRPLPFPDAASLFLVFETQGTAGGELQISVPTLEDWQRRSRTFSGLTGAAPALVTLRGEGEPEAVKAALVGAGFFPTLGVKMRLGRGFAPAEEEVHRPAPVIVLSEELWRSRFAADPAILGRNLRLGETAVTVVGVAPAGVQTPGGTQLWAPLSLAPGLFPTMPGLLDDRAARLVHVFGRAAPGQDRASARRDLAAVERRLAAEFPAVYRETGADLVPLRERAVRKVKASLLLLQLAVGLVLLMAAANLSSLALARGLDRGREISIRVALGVRRKLLVRQVLIEGLLVSLAGGAAGLLLAGWSLPLVLALAPARLPYRNQVALDAPVVLITLAVTGLAGLLSGLLPAWKISAPAFSVAERPAATVSDPLRSARLQSWLVGLETGLAVLLLIAAGLLVRSFLQLHQVPLGFEPRHGLALSLSLPADRYADPETTADFYRQVLERTAALPGVTAAGVASDAPLEGVSGTLTLAPPSGAAVEPSREIECLHVSPGYFRAIGATLLRGRDFTAADLQPRPRTLVINRTLARTLAARLRPGEDPVGKTLVRDGDRPVEIIGVVADVRHDGLAEEIGPVAYEPALWNNSTLFLRTTGDPAAWSGAARRAIAAVDPVQAPYRVDTLEGLVAKATSQARFSMLLFSSFGAVALVLGASGIFGLLSLFVVRRRREIGVRMALGAKRGDVLRHVLGNGLRLAGAGIAAALVAGFWLTRSMAGLLFEISATDTPSFLGAAALMGLVAFVSCLLPAWRASRVEPAVVLRAE